ncbi:hypothetical protein FE257_005405 [Aspergillus nanangensis]|uniref:F-box domain-containing protein n=1 Tax=Aspergillus nanangensis TaxID=2582783 RepID=A0AAD4GUP4_ASPNN|nr:hypothetical protein FE257_005405 [Aspergillus nanangensis]
MLSPTEQVLSICELTERIILQLNDPLEIIRAQRVCQTWRGLIQTSPILQKACWYQPHKTRDQSASDSQGWILNPAFNCIGVSVSIDTTYPVGGLQEKGDFTLEEPIYDKPGSWTTMLATQPPCHRMIVECYGDYSSDETMFYMIVSMTGPLLMGDIMAVLAECQNRQKCDLDRWAGVCHYSGRLVRCKESDLSSYEFASLRRMPNDDVSINVAAELPFGSGEYPAFSLRRLHSSKHFLHEMTLHKMIMYGGDEYNWCSEHGVDPTYDTEYKANLLVVREHQEGYLAGCSHIFRLLSDVE